METLLDITQIQASYLIDIRFFWSIGLSTMNRASG
jgi:hypothetical protein